MKLKVYKPTTAEIERTKKKHGYLKVSGDGIFYSIQGEGQTMGQPAVFLRLHNCNLHCSWCDTKYTWDSKRPEYWKENKNWSISLTIKKLKKYKCKRLVITGGEPLLQQTEISQLVNMIPGWEIEIETNGTVMPSQNLSKKCQFNVSPKLTNSGNDFSIRIKPAVLEFLNSLQKTNFKFVVRNKTDINEVDCIVKKCGLDKRKIIIMPEGITSEEIVTYAINIINDIKTRGWRILPRWHIFLWGNIRRV